MFDKILAWGLKIAYSQFSYNSNKFSTKVVLTKLFELASGKATDQLLQIWMHILLFDLLIYYYLNLVVFE